MSSVTALVALIPCVALVAKELVNTFTATAGFLSVRAYLSIKVVNTVVTLLNVVIGFGLPLGTGVRINANSCLCGWYVDCCLNTSIACRSVVGWPVITSQLCLETRVGGGSSCNWTFLQPINKSGNYGLVVLSHLQNWIDWSLDLKVTFSDT